MKAIDIHGHFGLCDNNNRDLNDCLMSGGIELVRQRAKNSNIRLTMVSALESLMPYGGNPLKGNDAAYRAAQMYPDIKFWTVIDPRKGETYDQAALFLKNSNCVGIKIHPTLHNYQISDYGEYIFRFAHLHNAIVLTHSGCNENPEDVLPFADEFENVKIILAHLGNSNDGKLSRQIHAIQQTNSKNVYVDTSSGCSVYSGLIEWAVSQIGSKNILFGSDTPLHFTGCMKARIEQAEISKEQKQDILFNNALRLFKFAN